MVKKADLETERPPSPMLGASQGGPGGCCSFSLGFAGINYNAKNKGAGLGGLRVGDGCRGESTSGLCSVLPGQAAPLLVPERGRNGLIWCLCGAPGSSAPHSRHRVVARWGRLEGSQGQTRPLPPAGCKHKLTSLCLSPRDRAPALPGHHCAQSYVAMQDPPAPAKPPVTDAAMRG